MALKLAITAQDSPIGVALTDAYFKVVDFSMPVNSSSVVFGVFVYADEAARRGSKEAVKRLDYSIANYDHSEAKNIKTKCYEYLKALDEYEDAVDV